jgi:hypothetical protein
MNSFIPREVEEAAILAEELHGKLFPLQTEEGTPDETVLDEQPAPEPEVEDAIEKEEPWEDRYKHLQGKYNKEVPRMAAELRELRQEMQKMQTTPPTQEPAITELETKKDEILKALYAEYPEELVENLRALQRIEAEEVAQRFMQPVQQQAQNIEDTQKQVAQENFVEYLNSKSSTWEPIWDAADALANGATPEDIDPKIYKFLSSPDPSGLYSNYELVHMYNEAWDADKLAAVCNLMNVQQAPRQSPSREAMVAPSRSKGQPSPPSNTEMNWNASSFEQFTRDDAAGKYDAQTSQALWMDAQKALAEGRFRP